MVGKVFRFSNFHSAKSLWLNIPTKRFLCKNRNNVLPSDFKVVKTDVYVNDTKENSFSLSLQNLLSQFSEKSFSKQLKQSSYLYIVDKNAADIVAAHITENSKNSYVLEANPGPGILSKALLDAGVPYLRIFEKNPDFISTLKVLKAMYPESVEIVKEDIMLLPSSDAKTRYYGTTDIKKYFYDIPEKSWIMGPPFKFVSVISSKRNIKFMRYLLATLPTMSSIFAYGRCEFYLLLCENEYMYMKAEPSENFSKYRWCTVLYNLFFEIKCLKKFSTDSFLPIQSKHSKKKKSQCESHLYLVKLTPKLELFESVAPLKKLPELYFFARHHLVKRTALVIPTMESWIPYCGPRLIKEGMNVFTKFGDLSPNQILSLFLQFSSWPEYDDSPFRAAVQSFYNRQNVSYDDDEVN